MNQTIVTGLEDLKDKHKGETCYIVGKGLSLKNIKKEDFGEGVVITLNTALTQVERLGLSNQTYAMMKENYRDNPPSKPQKAILLTSLCHGINLHKDYTPRYIFDSRALTDTLPEPFSAKCALKVAQLMGCNKIKLLCFDACTTEELRGIGENDEVYGKVRGYVEQCRQMHALINVEKMDVEWITP